MEKMIGLSLLGISYFWLKNDPNTTLPIFTILAGLGFLFPGRWLLRNFKTLGYGSIIACGFMFVYNIDKGNINIGVCGGIGFVVGLLFLFLGKAKRMK